MCGILFELLFKDQSILTDEELLKRISNRGPDCINKVVIDVGDGMQATFCGAVLWMQGPKLTLQPVETEHGILLYNGDIFDETWTRSVSDTQTIMDRITKLRNIKNIVQEVKSFKGPFSIIYYDKSSHSLFFTRDKIGRNTLLFYRTEKSLVISSVLGRRYKCVEIPATHMQILNLKTNEISIHSWSDDNVMEEVYAVDDWVVNLQKQQSIPDEDFAFDLEEMLNVKDEDGVIQFIEEEAAKFQCKLKLMTKLLENNTIRETVWKITELLEKSVKIRLETQPQRCKQCLYKDSNCDHCTVGILFSGGLDCTILAFLADKYLPVEQSIELLNVAFKKDANGSYEVPDRITGKQSFQELKKVCPRRKWIFKEVNVPKEELEAVQKSTIADLVYPRQTILDESLGSALWFAARGQNDHSTSSCRVLILGSGADELFGGYTRHRNAYKRQGWSGLHKELLLDWKRISFRNLARDNRVICDHGRQPRMPYLDEDFVSFVLGLQPWLKCFPSESLGQGVGDKLMLRLVAFHLGLKEVVTFPKRALQFGSRIANKKEKGSDVSKTFIMLEIKD
ncbi:asparagine synthase domain-containing protein [Phthorimaea operculella]|nr:asparagine synthase domain-containing protein [Phthorimaea operculella]